METQAKRLKHSSIILGAVLVMGFVLVQPTMNRAYAVGIEGLPAYDGCLDTFFPEDPTSMNTVRNKDIVKTVDAEKIIVWCRLNQGDLPVIVDVTIYLEVYENITSQEVIATNAFSTTCMKEPGFAESGGATVIDCESKGISASPVFVGSNCSEIPPLVTHPQEMNTVTKGKISKTIEAQKEVFFCGFKFVHIVLFTEIYEDLTTHETTSVQFLSARCVMLIRDFGDLQEADVESCIFTQIEN
jgi:hypothetical protein